MRKLSIVSLMFIILLLPLQASANSGNNDGSLNLDASRMENTNKASEIQDDLYIKYNIELFNNNGNSKAEQNVQKQLVSDEAMQQALFLAQSNATSSGIDLSQLFTSSQSTTKTEVKSETFDTAYLIYGIIIIAVIGLLVIITRATVKELQTNKAK
ncbi:type VII secretion protein EssA [Listeria booriae]|uniref:Type VII secretion protein EssA n=1 Tax=Listeria booriae TaxID=1552123 RepID=A0A7X1CI66_9LIST|nr:type VII secretion protein EssA [Listeria booriae]MBC1778679.1 type VII secretion protein EssA [Listeria booriae]